MAKEKMKGEERLDGLTAQEIVDLLSPEVLEAAYRKRELQYRADDVRNHFNDMKMRDDKYEGRSLSEEDSEEIAQEFLWSYDCNIPENELFEQLIKQWFSE